MNTKALMSLSAMVMAAGGIVLQFFPHEVLRHVGIAPDGIMPLLGQILGALYLGFAMLNWMAKAVLVGGIYARPLAMGNLMHFTVGALALLKYAAVGEHSWTIWMAVAIYSLLAIMFGIVLFTHPGTPGTNPSIQPRT